MAKLTQEQIELQAKTILDLFDDGFQWTDLGTVVAEAMKIAESVEGMTGVEKKETVVLLANYCIDQCDLPWLPDALVDPILKKAVPWIIELVIDASKGKIVNT